LIRRTVTMFPSIETMVLGVVITTALAVVDWYLWRLVPVSKYPAAATGTRYAESDTAFKEVA
jgi:hypothetical protein